MQLRAMASLDAVDRPWASLGFERGVVGRVPVASRRDDVEPGRQALDRLPDLIPLVDGEGAARREVVLEVDDQKRIGHRLAPSSVQSRF
jgi:hypothetical protein